MKNSEPDQPRIGAFVLIVAVIALVLIVVWNERTRAYERAVERMRHEVER